MATGKKTLGPRITVLFQAAQGKDSKAQYVYMLKSVAEKLGLKSVPDATVTRKPAKGSKKKGDTKIAIRGSCGAKRVKVPMPGARASTTKGKGVAIKYLSVPVPASANITQIKKFLQGASKKPTSFVSPNGRSYSLEKSTK